jgi:hypothetical protein
VAAGAVSAAYAGSLAWVANLQATADWERINERQPVHAAIDLLRTHHDGMAGRLGAAWDGYQAAAGQLAHVADGVSALNDGLIGLDRRVAEIERLAGSVPTRLQLPSIGSVSRPRPVTAKPAPPPPATNATSGASGG